MVDTKKTQQQIDGKKFKINNEPRQKGITINDLQRPKILNSNNEFTFDSATELDINYACNLGIYDDLFLDITHYVSYPQLAYYMQNPIINKVCGILSDDCIKAWGEIKSKSQQDKTSLIKAINQRIHDLDLKEKLKEAMQTNLGMGGAMLYAKLKGDEKELKKELIINSTKIGKGSLEYFSVISPLNCSPLTYNSSNPLLNTYYNPDLYVVGSQQIHTSRLWKIIDMPLPYLIRPRYNMFGLPLAGILAKYVSNFEQTRDAVKDIVKQYNIIVLKSDLRRILFDNESAHGLKQRMMLFSDLADNEGSWVIDKDSEDIIVVSKNLSNLEEILWQQAELICSISEIPASILWGKAPKGTLNSSGDGDKRNYYDKIDRMRKNNLLKVIHNSIDVIQLDLTGQIDPDLEFVFNPLWQMDDKDLSTIRLNRASENEKYVNMGAIDGEDVFVDLTTNQHSGYNHLGERERTVDIQEDNTDEEE